METIAMKIYQIFVVLNICCVGCTPRVMPAASDAVDVQDVHLQPIDVLDASVVPDGPAGFHDVPILRCPIWTNVDRIMEGQVDVVRCGGSSSDSDVTEPTIAEYQACVLRAFQQERPFVATKLGYTSIFARNPPHADFDEIVLLGRRTTRGFECLEFSLRGWYPEEWIDITAISLSRESPTFSRQMEMRNGVLQLVAIHPGCAPDPNPPPMPDAFSYNPPSMVQVGRICPLDR